MSEAVKPKGSVTTLLIEDADISRRIAALSSLLEAQDTLDEWESVKSVDCSVTMSSARLSEYVRGGIESIARDIVDSSAVSSGYTEEDVKLALYELLEHELQEDRRYEMGR